METVELIAVTLDLDGRMTYVNPYLVQLTGWTRQELTGADWLATFNGEDVGYIAAVRNDEVPAHQESPITTRTGSSA